jgi:hypothetical protein
MIVTEKLDGTNAQVHITDDGRIFAGSRNRWITPDADNFGFARWVAEHEEELRALGPGSHYGEWWGSGIQRRYGLDEKRFSLFNVGRWTRASTTTIRARRLTPNDALLSRCRAVTSCPCSSVGRSIPRMADEDADAARPRRQRTPRPDS